VEEDGSDVRREAGTKNERRGERRTFLESQSPGSALKEAAQIQP
jgi:hypothetical protein